MSRLRSAVLAAIVVAGAALPARAQEPARVRFVSLVPGAEVDVRARPRGGGPALEATGLAPGVATDHIEAGPDRYAIEVRSGGAVLERTSVGLAPGGRYTIAVVGLPAPGARPGPETLGARLRRIFGGADAVSADGYYPQVRVLRDGRDAAPAKARARVVHAAPGLVPLTLVARRGGRRVTLASGLRYPRTGAMRDLEPGRWTLELSTGSGTAALLEAPADLRAGTITTWLVMEAPGSGGLRLVALEDPSGSDSR